MDPKSKVSLRDTFAPGSRREAPATHSHSHLVAISHGLVVWPPAALCVVVAPSVFCLLAIVSPASSANPLIPPRMFSITSARFDDQRLARPDIWSFALTLHGIVSILEGVASLVTGIGTGLGAI